MKLSKKKTMGIGKVETTQQMMTDELRSEESDTPVEENEEAMWPEGGVLLKFVEKASREQKENAVTDIQATSIIEKPKDSTGSLTLFPKEDGKAKEELQKPQVEDISTPKEDCESSEKSQKSQIDSVVPTSLINQHAVESIGASMEEIVKENTLKFNMQEKLIKATKELGGEVESEENIQIWAIGLLLRIQAALDK